MPHLAPRPEFDTPWASPATELLARLDTTESGLTTEEAARRIERFGRNELEPSGGPSAAHLIVQQFRNPLIYILLAAAAVTFLIGEYLDAIAIAIVLLFNAVIGFVQEYRAERALEALLRLAPRRAIVHRDGATADVDAVLLVPGDVITIETGMTVPADARLISVANLEVDQAIITGESQPVAKNTEPVATAAPMPNRSCMVIGGSIVTRGRARAVITATGRDTEFGHIASAVAGTERGDTPLQQRMAHLARTIGLLVAIVGAVGMLAGLVRGIPIEELFLTLVALAVSAIPEGLPIVFTVALAIGLQRMVRRGVVIRRMPAVETLGSCDVIGSDKTGTLTENRMAVRRIVTPARDYEVTGGAFRDDGGIRHDGIDVAINSDPALRAALVAATLCNDSTLERHDGEFVIQGDPTEAALLVAAARVGLEAGALSRESPRVDEIPFESARRYAATLHQSRPSPTADGAGTRLLLVKGAPERVLELSAPEHAATAERLREAADRLASEGMRVLAVARRQLPAGSTFDEPHNLEPLGLFGSLDPPRAEAADAVRQARDAGIRVLMITGDHPATATAIARQVGLEEHVEHALTGEEIDHLEDSALYDRLGTTSVCARVSPTHKHRIVTLLQQHGHVVAVTGDGVNDAPALKAADIGVAMGLTGTDVAREAGDMVITDDNFASIVAAIEEGRVVFDNVRKSTYYLLSCNLGELIAVLASLFFGIRLPFLPAQLLWLNAVTDSVQAIALGVEPGERGILRRPPRARGEPIITRLLWERTVLVGAWIALGTLALFLFELERSDDIDRARTVALTVMVLFQAFHVLNARSQSTSVLRRMDPRSNRYLALGTFIAVGVHIAALQLAPFQALLSVEPLDLESWVRMIAVSASLVPAVELHRRFRRVPDRHVEAAS